MNENFKKFLDKVENDQELQAKFARLRDPEDAYKLASSLQEGFTREEFITEMKRLFEEAAKDVSEEDIAKVAGGSIGEAAGLSAGIAGVAGIAATAAAV